MKSIIREASDLYICVGGSIRHIDFRNLIYAEHKGREVLMITLTGTVSIPYISLEKVYQEAGEENLLRCHRSYLINPEYIARVNRGKGKIELRGRGERIPLGRKYRKAFYEKIHLTK